MDMKSIVLHSFQLASWRQLLDSLLLQQSVKLKGVRGSVVYCLTFMMFGTMMPDAAYTDCWLSANPGNIYWDYFCAILDVGLTSSIGLSFFFSGLVDVGLLNENIKTYTLMGFSYATIFAAWTWSFYYQNYLDQAFMYLYVYLIGISCGIYCITETIHIISSKSIVGLGWVAVAGAAGAIGLAAIDFPQFDYWLCKNLGCHFAGDFIWFLLSDVAMYCCFKYFMARVDIRRDMYQKNIARLQGYSSVPTDIPLNSF